MGMSSATAGDSKSTATALPDIELEESIPARIATVAAALPEKLAVDDGRVKLDYRALTEWSNRIAARLRGSNLDPERPVAIAIAPGALQIASTFGVLAAGHFYVPLDPTTSNERTLRILDEATASIVLVDNESAISFVNDGSATWRPFNIEALDQSGTTLIDGTRESTPTSLAYVLFTSGSTGKPKGVVHDHTNVLHNARRHAQAYGITPEDRQSLLYTPGVYGGQRDLYNALLNGASLHVYSLRALGIAGLRQWLENERITIYCSVTTVFRRLCGTLDGPSSLTSLRLVKLGGEASYRSDVELFQRFFPPHCKLHCGLGSTELGLARSYFVDHSTSLQGDAVPLGYAVDDVLIEVRDEGGASVADGAVGEIVVCSRFIALGYWRDALATERSFSSVDGVPGMRRFRTGDLGVLMPGGCLEYRGRCDAQIKLHGNRVDPVEIENALLRLDEIREAAVVVQRDERGHDMLVSFLVGSGDTRPSNASLRGILAMRLPSHMIPSRFVWLDELPALENGKLDRASLRMRELPAAGPESSVQAPRSIAEARLLDAWRAMLGVTSAGIDDDFFALGGDSLKMMAMLTWLDAEFSLDLPPSTFMSNATVRRIAALLQTETGSRQVPVLVPLRETGSRPALFCVHGIFGSALILRSLMPFLPLDRPLYEFQSPHLDGSRFRYTSLRALSAHYLESMMAVSPAGPYYLCGFSFGGLIALELAALLRAAGREVAYLAVIDGHPPRHRPRPSPFALGELKRLGWRTAADGWFAGLAGSVSRWQMLLRDASCVLGFRVPQAARRAYLRSHHALLSQRHWAPLHVGDVDVFYTEGREQILRRRWASAVDGTVNFLDIPGEHATLHEWPYAPVFAAKLAARLAACDERIHASLSLGHALRAPAPCGAAPDSLVREGDTPHVAVPATMDG